MGDDTSIRIAAPDDFNELMRLSLMLHSENGQHAVNMDKAMSLIWRGVTRQNAIVGVIGPHDDIKAVVYLSIEEVYYSDDLQLVELFVFTRPDSRKTDYTKRLVQFAKRCADETGLHLLIGIISDSRLEAKARLYDRLLPKGGVFYVYKPERAGAQQAA